MPSAPPSTASLSSITDTEIRDRLAGYEAGFLAERRRQRIVLAIGAAVFALMVYGSAIVSGFLPERLAAGLPRIGDYVYRTLPEMSLATILGDIAYWYWGIDKWLLLLFDTLMIAVFATLLGTLGGFVFCFAASRNLMRSYSIYFVCRRVLEIARTVPELVYALIFVVAFGIGPFAGVLAIAIHSWGALGKLYAEVNENVDQRAIEGVRAAGGNWFEEIRYAVLPQVLPNFTTYTLWRLELNVRSAAIIGFVGAGGIGQELYHAISFNYHEDISAIVLMIVLTVTCIDLLCERIRHRMIGRENLT